MPKATFEYERPNYRHQTYNATTICSSDQIVPESTLLPLNPQDRQSDRNYARWNVFPRSQGRRAEACAKCKISKQSCTRNLNGENGRCDSCERKGSPCEPPPPSGVVSRRQVHRPEATAVHSSLQASLQDHIPLGLPSGIPGWPQTTSSPTSTNGLTPLTTIYDSPLSSASQVPDLQKQTVDNQIYMPRADPAQLLRNVEDWARGGDSDAQYACHFLTRFALRAGLASEAIEVSEMITADCEVPAGNWGANPTAIMPPVHQADWHMGYETDQYQPTMAQHVLQGVEMQAVAPPLLEVGSQGGQLQSSMPYAIPHHNPHHNILQGIHIPVTPKTMPGSILGGHTQLNQAVTPLHVGSTDDWTAPYTVGDHDGWREHLSPPVPEFGAHAPLYSTYFGPSINSMGSTSAQHAAHEESPPHRDNSFETPSWPGWENAS